jgi:hypothetical protein
MRALILLAFLLSGCSSIDLNEPITLTASPSWEPVQPAPLPYYGPPVAPVRWHLSRGCCVRAQSK